MTASSGITASLVCAPLIDGPVQPLQVAHRARESWQLVDQRGMAVCCVITPRAVRLPNAFVVDSLPRGASPISVGGGSLGWGGSRVRIARWWRPARPHLLSLRARLHEPSVAAFCATWSDTLGRGEGLTPYADDVVCGSLLTLRAGGHPAAAHIASDVRRIRLERHTTAASAGLLRLASHGWCIDALADYLTALSRPISTDDAHVSPRSDDSRARLSQVGHSSGLGLIEGVHRMLSPLLVESVALPSADCHDGSRSPRPGGVADLTGALTR